MQTSLPSVDKLDSTIIKRADASMNENLAKAYQHYYLDTDQFFLPRGARELFYGKALRAKSAEVVNPVVVTDSVDDTFLRKEFIADREILSQQLRSNHRPGDIPVLAQAQAAFDCQIILSFYDLPDVPDRICKRRFDKLIARLQSPLWPKLEYHVFFESNRSVLERDAIQTLQNVAQMAKRDPESVLIIAGNSDRRGSIEANQRLAVQRARAVRNILLQFGVKESEITLLEDNKDYPAFFALERDTTARYQRRVSILVNRNLVNSKQTDVN